MNIKRIISEQLLLEKKIALIRANLTITYDLRHDERETYSHGEKRKWRHVSSGGDKIYDLYIKDLVEAAKDEITINIVQDRILNNVRFIVSQIKDPHLNVIIEPKMKNPYDWVLSVISVMNKKDFEVGRNQVQIFA